LVAGIVAGKEKIYRGIIWRKKQDRAFARSLEGVTPEEREDAQKLKAL
jgi:hypothetical protein